MKTKLLLMLIALIFAYPTFGQSGSTKRVAILETVDKEGKVPYGIKLMVRSKLSAVITAVPGYEGYDRVDIASILGEQDFQRTGLVSDKDIKQLGEMTGADYILVAEVAYLNSSYIFLSAKILNVETARVERTANTQSQTTVEKLETDCRLLAGKLLNVNTATGAVKGELMIENHRYVGEYINGKPHGRGTIYFSASDSYKRKSYEGDWANGYREGNGTMIWDSGEKYVGAWKDGLRNGYGTDYYANGDIYEGNWLNDKRHGKGKITFSANDSYNRKSYEGDWLQGFRHGTGTMIWNNGNKYIGGWKNGNRYGKGVHYYSNGDKYDGDWVDDKKHGKGTHYFKNGTYEVAEYQNGECNGAATHYFKGGYWKGYYVNGEEEGDWAAYNSKGHRIATKVYKNGSLIRTKNH